MSSPGPSHGWLGGIPSGHLPLAATVGIGGWLQPTGPLCLLWRAGWATLLQACLAPPSVRPETRLTGSQSCTRENFFCGW